MQPQKPEDIPSSNKEAYVRKAKTYRNIKFLVRKGKCLNDALKKYY